MNEETYASQKALSAAPRKLTQKEIGRRVLSDLMRAGVSYVSFVPETCVVNSVAELLQETDIPSICASNEGEAVSMAAGAWLGGKTPAVLMEDSGLFVATWAIESICLRYGIPVLLVIIYRGDIGDPKNSWFFARYKSYMEPLLRALGLQYVTVSRLQDLEQSVSGAVFSMEQLKQPVAIMLTGEFLR